jgi:hypothetical protein
MTDFDRRRSRYVPVDVMIAFGEFGSKLIEKWGMEGICAWLLFLAACKREPVQGTFTYTTDEEGWRKLGAAATGFSLDTFFTHTGHQKKTRRTRHGRIKYVTCTSWDEWNTPGPGRQKSRKSAENTKELRENAGENLQITGAEGEAEVEGEFEVEGVLYALPDSAEVENEVDRILRCVHGADGKSRGTLVKYANRVPHPRLADIRERAETASAKGRRKGVGWVMNALKEEAA